MRPNVQRIPGILRRRLEGLVFLCCLPFLGTALGVIWLGGRNRPTGEQGDRAGNEARAALRATCRRWVTFLTEGLGPLRQAWWVQFSLERPWTLWRYVLLFECVELRNLRDAQRRRPRHASAQKRYLVIKPGHLGDALHMVPMLKALRAQEPGARIDLLVGPWCEQLAARIPYVDEYLVYAPHLEQLHRGDRRFCSSLPAEWRFFSELGRRRYDFVISTSITGLIEWLLIRAACPDTWVGVEPGTDLYFEYGRSRTVPYDAHCYEAKRVLGLLTLIGLEADAPARLEYGPEEADAAFIEALLARHHLSDTSTKVVMAPGSGWPGKNWPTDRFAALADSLICEYGTTVLLTGSTDESVLGEEIESRMMQSPINLLGRLTLDQLAALLQRVQLFIGNDSAPLHLAAAMDTPTLSFFGPTSTGKWAPKGERHLALQADYRCAGCHPWHPRARCKHGHSCMKAIGLVEAKAAVQKLLRQVQPATVAAASAAAKEAE